MTGFSITFAGDVYINCSFGLKFSLFYKIPLLALSRNPERNYYRATVIVV